MLRHAAMEAIEFFDGEQSAPHTKECNEHRRNGGHRVLRWRVGTSERSRGHATRSPQWRPSSSSMASPGRWQAPSRRPRCRRNGGHRVLRWRAHPHAAPPGHPGNGRNGGHRVLRWRGGRSARVEPMPCHASRNGGHRVLRWRVRRRAGTLPSAPAAMEAIEFFDGEEVAWPCRVSRQASPGRNGGHRVLRWRAHERRHLLDDRKKQRRNGGHRVLRWRVVDRVEAGPHPASAAMEAIEFFDGESAA